MKISIEAAVKEYQVHIGSRLLNNLAVLFPFERYSSIVIISDSNVAPHYLYQVHQSLLHIHMGIGSFIFNQGEESKILKTVEKAYQYLVECKADRHTLLICLGGGVVSDLGGFVAATYMRGIDYISIPTTLESMVDASIGGKTGVNFYGIKNYIGAFHQPSCVVIDVETLATLPKRAFVQGVAEIVKHGLIADTRLIEQISQCRISQDDLEALIPLINQSLAIKSQIITNDVSEQGQRKLLNFGHTVGHVVETLSHQSKHPLFHGEAVAIGMVAESYLSHLAGFLSSDEFNLIETLIQKSGLPTRFRSDCSVDEVYDMLFSDKKNRDGKIKWTLLDKIGHGIFDKESTEVLIKKSIQYIFQ